jgi:hypothetical protein
MRLVPRQLRKTTFPGSVAWYGGRLTPQTIAGLEHPPVPPGPAGPVRPPPVPSREVPVTGDTARHLDSLEHLRQAGVLTEQEYQAARRRVTGAP